MKKDKLQSFILKMKSEGMERSQVIDAIASDFDEEFRDSAERAEYFSQLRFLLDVIYPS